MHTLKMRIFLHKVVGFLQIASVSMVTSRQSGRYLGVNTGLLAAQEQRYRCGQRPLEYTMSMFYFTAVTFQYFKVFLVKEGSVQTCSAPEWREVNSNNPNEFKQKASNRGNTISIHRPVKDLQYGCHWEPSIQETLAIWWRKGLGKGSPCDMVGDSSSPSTATWLSRDLNTSPLMGSHHTG